MAIRPKYTKDDLDFDGLYPNIFHCPWLSIDGVRSYSVNTVLLNRPLDPIPKRKTQTVNISGYHGQVVVDGHGYENVDIQYNLGISSPDDENLRSYLMDLFTQWIQPYNASKYVSLQTSYDEYHFRKGIFVGPTDIKNVLTTFGSATATFNCLPQKFLYPEDVWDIVDNTLPLKKEGATCIIPGNGSQGLRLYSQPKISMTFKPDIKVTGVRIEFTSATKMPNQFDITKSDTYPFEVSSVLTINEIPGDNRTIEVDLGSGDIYIPGYTHAADYAASLDGVPLIIDDISVKILDFGSYYPTLTKFEDLFSKFVVEPRWYVL